MAISAIMGAISTAVAVVSSATPFVFLGLTGATAIAARFLVTTALGALLNSLTPKPNLRGTSGYSLSGASGSALDHQIVYGEARVGGVRLYDSSTGTDNSRLHRILAFAGHEIDSYQAIYLNDEQVTIDGSGNVTSPSRYSGLVRIKTYLGTSTQTADPDLISETSGLTDGMWTSNHRLRGIAYIYVRFIYSQDVFPNGVPSLSARIRGRKVYNPHTGTTAWSNNPALCIRDYLTSDHGLDQPASRIDDNLVNLAAVICDQTVDSESRYTCNGSFTTAVDPATILTNMLTSMGGILWYGQGKWRMRAAAYTSPTLTLDENDLRSPVNVATRHSRRDSFNSVRGTFAGEETDWQVTDYPAVDDGGAYIVTDNNVENVLDLPLPFTSTSKTAQRIARIALRRNREQLTVSASFGLRAFSVQVGDVVALTNSRFGWSAKPFEVVSWTFGITGDTDVHVQLILREISSNVFGYSSPQSFELNNTTLPNPFNTLAPTGLTVSDGGFTAPDGTFVNSLIISWTPPANAFVSHYELEWRRTTDSVYNTVDVSGTRHQVSPVQDNVNYTIRVRAVTVLDVRGSYASATFTAGGDVVPPALPTSVVATGAFKYVTIRWTNPADADLSHVEVYENTTNTSVGATLVGTSAGDQFIRANLGLNVTRYYFLKSVDYVGNKSAFTSGVAATTTYLDDPDFSNGVYSLFTAQGLYAIRDVTSLPGLGAFVGEKIYNRTDGKLYQWTGSAWTLVIADVAAGSITAVKIANAAVEESKLATGAATEAKIATNAITETKISSNAVTSAKISAGAVIAGKIAAGAVQAGNIAAGAIVANDIAAGTITGNKIATNTLTATNIAAGTITGDRIAANTITGGLIAASGIITNSAQINNGLITNALIQDAAIGTSKIGDAQITNAKIQNAAVDHLKISGRAVTIPVQSTGGVIYGWVAQRLATSVFIVLPENQPLIIWWEFMQTYASSVPWGLSITLNGNYILDRGGTNNAFRMGAVVDFPSGSIEAFGVAGGNTVNLYWNGAAGVDLLMSRLIVTGFVR